MFLKVFLRLVVPVTAVYLFFVCGFLVSAEEDAAGEEKQYKTSISFYYNSLGNMSGGTDSFTVVSGKPFYMFYRYTEEPACYPMYFCGDLEDFIALRDSAVFGFQFSLSVIKPVGGPFRLFGFRYQDKSGRRYCPLLFPFFFCHGLYGYNSRYLDGFLPRF